MLNRPDGNSVPGGDTVQMQKTKAGLERLGVEVKIGEVQDLFSSIAYDIVHIFNWQCLSPILAQIPADRPMPCIVHSPIFWFHTGQWFEHAADSRFIWKIARKTMGKQRACRLYEAWQRAKFSGGNEGRELRRQLMIPDRILPNSTIELDYLEQVLGIRGRLHPRSTLVPNGVDFELFHRPPQPSQRFMEEYGFKDFVIQVARIQSAKNQLGLIEALFDLPVPIVFAGQPSPYEAEYVARCHERGRQRGNVYFIGSRPQDELTGILALAAVHALPSWRETPGLASLEAGAAGCRIVTTAVGSASEYFHDMAWYCDPANIRSIRQAVMAALSSPPSLALRDHILACYTWDKAASATLNGYEKAINYN